MIPVYQTRLPKLARALKEQGFDYTLKNKIYQFEYTIEFGKIKDELLLGSGNRYESST